MKIDDASDTWNRKTFSLQEDNDYIVNYKPQQST